METNIKSKWHKLLFFGSVFIVFGVRENKDEIETDELIKELEDEK